MRNKFKIGHSISESQKREIFKQLKAFLENDKKIVFAYLFGSFIEYNIFRDIDIGIYITEIENEIEIEMELKRKLSDKIGYAVDISVINNAPPDVKLKILSGKLLLCKDRELMTDFIEEAGKHYIEYSHFQEVAMDAIVEAVHAKS
jgi:predicted nucleotidyltransferase